MPQTSFSLSTVDVSDVDHIVRHVLIPAMRTTPLHRTMFPLGDTATEQEKDIINLWYSEMFRRAVEDHAVEEPWDNFFKASTSDGTPIGFCSWETEQKKHEGVGERRIGTWVPTTLDVPIWIRLCKVLQLERKWVLQDHDDICCKISGEEEEEEEAKKEATMASPKVSEALAQIQSSPDQPAAFESLLDNLNTLSTPQNFANDLKAILNTAFHSLAVGVVAQRAVLDKYVAALRGVNDADLWVELGTYALSIVEPSSSGGGSSGQALASGGTFPDQAAALRELAADGHEAHEDHDEAAATLAQIALDSSQRRVTDEDRVRVWVRIVRNYLEVDNTVAAETYLNKLKNVIYQVDDPTLNLHFRLSQARIQDAKREFLSASQAYHDISHSPAISEDERLHTLSMAVKCAILAPAGPLRSRALGRLFKDERAPHLDEFGMLEKMFFDRLLAPAEVDKFARGLAPHQLALTADGSTVLARAVVEHNLLAVSRLYLNVDFASLAAVLGSLDPAKAEDTTARMIEQGRLAGRIDQIEGVVYFEGGFDEAAASGEKGGGSGRADGASVGREMRRWDANVQGLAEEVENVTNLLQREFPDFVAANLVV
ncbi:hypothetical protein Hte_005141 [Hypoxylon texense]